MSQDTPEIDTLLKQGIDAARVGRKENARALLMRVVETDERNEMAWLWLSGVVETPEDQRICLENVLDINPGSLQARRGLEILSAREGQAPVASPQAPVASPQAPVASPQVPVASPQAPVASPQVATFTLPPTVAGPQIVAPGNTPCPYCGAGTLLSQKRCPQCRRGLTMRGDVPEKRSIALIVLVVLWGLSAVSNLLTGVGGGATSLRASQEIGGGGVGAVALLINLAIGLIGALIPGSIAWGLWQRKRWAYIVNAVLVGLSVIGLLVLAFMFLIGGGMGAAALQQADAPQAGALMAGLAAILGMILLCVAVMVVLQVALTVLSYGDFYGARARLMTDVPMRDDVGHYNAGITYKNRGMWFLAGQEWEAAVKLRPRDADYRHALGLAYAQLKRFPEALRELREAVAIAPADPRLQESLAIVEQRAGADS